MEPEFCARCESVGRKSQKNAHHKAYGLNGQKCFICDECYDEIQYEIVEPDEIEEDERAS